MRARSCCALTITLTIFAPIAFAALGGTNVAHATPPPPPPAPTIELVTMGTGDELFTRFGHAALRVIDPAGETDLVYNYGVTSWKSPARLVVDFLLGHVAFWVEATPWSQTIDAYVADDRTITLQALALSDDEARALAWRLALNSLPANRFYVYDHYRANCSTKVRDQLDVVTGGLIARATRPERLTSTYRALSRPALANDPLLLVAEELALGAIVDRPLSAWQAMFLPAILARELETVRTTSGVPLAGPPIVVYARRAPPAVAPSRRGLGGLRLLAGTSVVLLALLALLALAGRRSRRAAGAALAVAALLTALAGLLLWILAVVSVHPILRWNANLLVLWPTDLYLTVAGVSLVQRGRPDRLLAPYAIVRLVAIAAVALLEIVHAVPQAGLAVALFAATPSVGALVLVAAWM